MPHSLNSHVPPSLKETEHQDNTLPTQLLNSSSSKNGKLPELSSDTSTDDWSSATSELLDTLPQVWTRGLLYFFVVFVGIVLPWALLCQIDETGTARGRIEPNGNSFKVDAPVAGTVAKVLVNEGQFVNDKQPLLELESEPVRSELQQAQTKLEGQLNRLSQLELIKNQLTLAIRTQQQQNKAQELEKLAQIEQARQSLSASKTAYTLQQEKLAQIEQAQRYLSASKTAYILADSRYARDVEEVRRYRKLWKEGVVPEIKVIEMEKLSDESRRLLTQAEADVKQAEARLKEQQGSYQKIIHQATAEIKQYSVRLKEQESGYQSLIQAGKLAVLKTEEQLKEMQTQITSLQAETSQSKSQIQALKFQLEQRVLRAPVSGTIFQLPIQRAGAFVQPSQMVAEIAPQGARFVLKAQMATGESGSLREGMPVKMKFDAYPFQDYGVVEGRLSRISPSSKITETAQGQIATFDLEIEIKKPCIQTSSECIALTPGQTATAEVIVRQRSIIDLILDPFKKLQKGGLEL